MKLFKVKRYEQDIKHLILSVEFNAISLRIFNQCSLKYDNKGMDMKSEMFSFLFSLPDFFH